MASVIRANIGIFVQRRAGAGQAVAVQRSQRSIFVDVRKICYARLSVYAAQQSLRDLSTRSGKMSSCGATSTMSIMTLSGAEV